MSKDGAVKYLEDQKNGFDIMTMSEDFWPNDGFELSAKYSANIAPDACGSLTFKITRDFYDSLDDSPIKDIISGMISAIWLEKELLRLGKIFLEKQTESWK